MAEIGSIFPGFGDEKLLLAILLSHVYYCLKL